MDPLFDHLTKVKLIQQLDLEQGAFRLELDAKQATIREQAELISQYETALLRAEQTIRNLGNGFLTGDGKEIALNEAANIREALKASAK